VFKYGYEVPERVSARKGLPQSLHQVIVFKYVRKAREAIEERLSQSLHQVIVFK